MDQLNKGLKGAQQGQKSAEIDTKAAREDARCIAERFVMYTGADSLAQQASSIQAVIKGDIPEMERTKNRPRVVLDSDYLERSAEQILSAKSPDEAKAISASFMAGYIMEMAWAVFDLAEKAGTQNPYAAVRDQIKQAFSDKSAPQQEQRFNEQVGEIVWQVYRGALVSLLSAQVMEKGLVRGPFKDGNLVNYKLSDPEQNRDAVQTAIAGIPINSAKQSGIMKQSDLDTHDEMGWKAVVIGGLQQNKVALKVIGYQIVKIIQEAAKDVLASQNLSPGSPHAQQYNRAVQAHVQSMVLDAESTLLAMSIIKHFEDRGARLVGNPALLLNGTQGMLRSDTLP